MKKILVVIDPQNDYTSGRLFGNDFDLDVIINNIANKIKHFDNGILYVTLDTHDNTYLDTPEGKRFPVKHCMYMSDGWILDRRIFEAVQKCNTTPIYYQRAFYGCNEMINDIVKFYNDWKDEDVEIEFCGVAPEGTLLINALMVRGLCPNARIIVDSDCCFGFVKATCDFAYTVMEGSQIEIVGSNFNNVIYDNVHRRFHDKFGLEDYYRKNLQNN